jgi:hypothetical protein
LRKYINIILAAIIFQAGIYIYFDRVILIPAASFSQQIVTEGSKEATDPQKISTDRKYYAKVENSGVSFYNADNKMIKEVSLQALEENVTYFSWVPNTHLALIGISNDTSKGTIATLKAINLDTNSFPQEPKISGLSKGSKIENVAFSPQTNVTYIMISNKSSKSIYRTDANNRLTKVFSNSTVSRIACLQSVDMLLCDNIQNKSVYSYSSGKQKAISPKTGKYVLIGSDKDDNVYIGQLNSSGLVTSVLKGTINGNFKEFKTFVTPSSQSSITITYDGKLNVT